MALGLPTGRRGKALALAMTLLAGVAVWLGIVAPILGWYDDRAELLRRETAMARRMMSLVATLPALRLEASRVNGAAPTDGGDPDADMQAALLTGASDPLAAASLQQRVEEFASKTGVQVGSEEILPGQAEGNLRAISVRLTMTAPYQSLVALLLALARSETPMVVDELLMRGPPGKPGDGDPPVEASFTVTSYRPAKADTQ
jgi:general secretion pathway protein M